MPQIYETRADRLVLLSCERFAGDLTAAEVHVLRHSTLPEISTDRDISDRDLDSTEGIPKSPAEVDRGASGAGRPPKDWKAPHSDPRFCAGCSMTQTPPHLLNLVGSVFGMSGSSSLLISQGVESLFV